MYSAGAALLLCLPACRPIYHHNDRPSIRRYPHRANTTRAHLSRNIFLLCFYSICTYKCVYKHTTVPPPDTRPMPSPTAQTTTAIPFSQPLACISRSSPPKNIPPSPAHSKKRHALISRVRVFFISLANIYLFGYHIIKEYF